MGRGDLLGAGISAVGILLPVVGDLAKVGKLGKFVGTISRAEDVAKTDAKFAESIRPLMQRLKSGLDQLPMYAAGIRMVVEIWRDPTTYAATRHRNRPRMPVNGMLYAILRG